MGEKRARALESWRQDIENRAPQVAPSKLSAPEQRALADRTAADRTRLQSDRKKAESDAQADRSQLQLGKSFDRSERPLEPLGLDQPSRMSADR